MNNFHIYRDGKYDRRANLKAKIDDKANQIKADLYDRFLVIDYYFVNHKWPDR